MTAPKKDNSAKQFQDLKWLMSKVRESVDNNFYGDMKITFFRGAIAQIEIRSTELPPSKPRPNP